MKLPFAEYLTEAPAGTASPQTQSQFPPCAIAPALELSAQPMKTFLKNFRGHSSFAARLPRLLIASCFVFQSLSGCGVLKPEFRSLGKKTTPLIQIEPDSLSPFVAHDDAVWFDPGFVDNRAPLMQAVENSISYLRTKRAANDYRSQENAIFSQELILKSLLRFRELVLTSKGTDELRTRVRSEFDFYRSTGRKGKRDVLFTGYCEPLIGGSFQKTAEFSYPLFRKPAGFDEWKKPHPKRRDLVGYDGFAGAGALLHGGELVYLRDRMDVAMIQIQGSARIRLADGSTVGVGFDGATAHPFKSIAAQMIRDGKITASEASMPRLKEYFRRNPEELDRYMSMNDRFVFFRVLGSTPAIGSTGVPVISERTIATDKSVFPPGALAIAVTNYPMRAYDGSIRVRPVSRFVLDQDTGSAIKGPGRVDLFVGTGEDNCHRAGMIKYVGALYYPVLKGPAQDDERS